ncbi:MAG: hypothetical protein IPL28_13040 [Chloroflexi bacterium]|nr:hypothetical protein [Chloroflexota bacterium]
MQTYSHFLLTAALPAPPPTQKAWLAGAILPDVPLVLLTLGYILDRRYLRPHLPDKTRCSPTYNHLYFHNPWWIAAHNTLHAPLPLFALGLMGYLARHTAWGSHLLWFALGCGLHGAIDIFTHADDGPVLLFPLEWRTRFQSPISYWDIAHHGRLFRLLEHILDALLIGWLIWQRTQPTPQRARP